MTGAFALVVAVLANGAGESGDAIVNSLGMSLRPIPPGRFVMGSDLGRDHWDEGLAHPVAISTALAIGEREVTVGEFRRFRPDFGPRLDPDAPATGVSWHDATAFCAWLSAAEGASYRLPTEAEWEYACRAGSDSVYANGDTAPDAVNDVNVWGVRGMHTGALEWCADWYGPYSAEAATDPRGPDNGFGRVVRGGSLDDAGRYFHRRLFSHCASRASMAPSFGSMPLAATPDDGLPASAPRPGLVGTWFATEEFERPQQLDRFERSENNWINDIVRGARWSGRWRGSLVAPRAGRATFRLAASSEATVRIGEGLELRSLDGAVGEGSIDLRAGERRPIELAYVRRGGGEPSLRLTWSFDGGPADVIGPDALSHTAEDIERAIAEGAALPPIPGEHAIGFRVVRADPIERAECAAATIAAGVQPPSDAVRVGPDPTRPYFRKRRLLPMPPDNADPSAIDAAGLAPAFRPHNHCPALEVCPNGDVLAVLFTSYNEYEPGVTLLSVRLRFGADEWDMPERFVSFAGTNNHAPLLWVDRATGRMWFFWGSPRLVGGYPFQWTTSDDSGATWSEVRFPCFASPIGPHSRQPINTVLRDADGTLFVASDGNGGQSVLWATGDDGATWRDTGGRTIGRHTTYALADDGRTLLGFGGKNTAIDGFMPVGTSRDGGVTWTNERTPFPAVGGNQRPSVLRLASGRLIFASDYQHIDGTRPPGVDRGGAFVAISEDDGATWRFHPLPGAQRHEYLEYHGGAATLGYSAMRQAPNGLIHLVTTMNEPCLHFEFNEAWVLASPEEDAGRESDGAMASMARSIGEVRPLAAATADGGRIEYALGRADDGRMLRQGAERWFDAAGVLRHEATRELGRVVGEEKTFDERGRLRSVWRHRDDGVSVWTQYAESGSPVAESSWRSGRCVGVARRWNVRGELVAEFDFGSDR